MNKVILALCMLVTSLPGFLGLYLFAKGARRIQLAIASRKWPMTAGIVVGSETTRDPDLAVIEPGNASASLIMPGIGVVLVLMSMAVFYWVAPALGK